MTDLEIVRNSATWSSSDFSHEVACEYEKFSKHAFQHSYSYQANLALYLSDLISSGGDVLELGCGPGWLGIVMKRVCHKARITLTDHSSEMLRQAKKNVEESCLDGFKLSLQNAIDLKLPDNSYDLVVSQFMLRQVPNPKKAVQEAYRVLRPGGLIYFTDVTTVEEKERQAIIDQAPGESGPLFMRAALDSTLSKEQLQEIALSCGAGRSYLGFGGLGGFSYPSREILDLVKKGFPLRQLEQKFNGNEWSSLIAPYWAHLYIYKR